MIFLHTHRSTIFNDFEWHLSQNDKAIPLGGSQFVGERVDLIVWITT